MIVPVQCEYLSLRGLVQLENTLSMIRENLNPDVAIQGILPTMYDKRLLHSREAVEILKENFGDLVFNTKIRKTIRYAEAPVKGQSVLKYDPSGDAADALPRPGEGGAQWRESARACVRARSRSSSARPRQRRQQEQEAPARAGRGAARVDGRACPVLGGRGRHAGPAARRIPSPRAAAPTPSPTPTPEPARSPEPTPAAGDP